MVHITELKRMRSVLTERNTDLQEELKSLPDGELYALRKGSRWFYYQLLPKEGNRKKAKRSGISGNRQMVHALVRKYYVTRALKQIEKDIKVLDMAIKHYKRFDEEAIMGNFISRHPELVQGVYHGIQNDAEWADDYERQNDFYEKSRTSTSASGVMMRSKNEVYIASRLDHFGIPYRYEAAIPHPDTSRVPDFTIRRPRDGKIIYWEHLGLISDKRYMESNELKFTEYENVDIVPWDNLIITYDTKDGGIDAKLIDAMIQGWLL